VARSIAAAWHPNARSISFRPDAVKWTTRARRSVASGRRSTKPRSSSRSTATLIEPLVRLTFSPIVFTGVGPLCSTTSSTPKSE
jgi:hypothetical protein